MLKEVEAFIKNCVVCQQVKYSTERKKGLLQPLKIPKGPWEDLAMDFIVGLPKSNEFTAIMVVIDKFTKMAHFGGLKKGFSAAAVATLFVNMVVKLHGFPKSIISDRDPIFFSRFWHQLMMHSGTKLYHSTAYHPESDGQSEVLNRWVEQYLRAFTFHQPHKWFSFLPCVEFWYNSSFHSAIGMSPFQAVYGISPSPMPSYVAGTENIHSLDGLLSTRQELQLQLQFSLEKAQVRMKKLVDMKRQEAEFAVDDFVWVKLHHYRQNSLELPEVSKIYPVFHFSLLKKFCGDKMDQVLPFPKDFASAVSFSSLPERVVAQRNARRGEEDVLQVLVEWQGVPREEATWEDWEALTQVFSTKDLEGKVIFYGEGNHTHQSVGLKSFVRPEAEVDTEGPKSSRIRRLPKWAEDYEVVQGEDDV
ncbi:Retrotransposable element Tf2 [Senna tora]|uniref:Retrotransposable element Tf2 n=1 Tax=Senna tora TaxID=362788 RepID=A0A834WC77_9FABA|nr:Retrotransposable element Tf2 [Senna tora]